MTDLRVEPFRLRYEGLDAKQNRVDALYLGQSLQGTARVYNSVIDWHFHGKIRNHTQHHMRIQVGPPARGSLMYMVYVMLVHGKMPLYPELLIELAKLVVPNAVKAIIARRSGQNKLLETAIDNLQSAYERHDEFARQVHNDHIRDKDKLFQLVDRLVEINNQPLSHMAAPIGRTVAQLEHFHRSPEAIVVDEPLAEALRVQDAEVGEMETFTGKILGVDKPSASCKFQIDGSEKMVRCRITDPILRTPKNVYTHSLDADTRVRITAKPVLKAGEITTLYVMDAKPEKRTKGTKKSASSKPKTKKKRS